MRLSTDARWRAYTGGIYWWGKEVKGGDPNATVNTDIDMYSLSHKTPDTA
jgi:hypothetical protein